MECAYPGPLASAMIAGSTVAILSAVTVASVSSWSTPAPVPSSSYLVSASCVTKTFCVVVGKSGAQTYINGSWGTPVQDRFGVLKSVSCVSMSFCIAVDNEGYEFEYTGGTTWLNKQIDAGAVLTSVSCSTATSTETFCIAVDDEGYALT